MTLGENLAYEDGFMYGFGFGVLAIAFILGIIYIQL